MRTAPNGLTRPARPQMTVSASTVMAKSGRENFPVAARFLPSWARRDLLAVYGFARLVDDLGDEAAGDRPAQLGAIAAELDRVFGARPGPPTDPLLVRLTGTVSRHDLPRDPFDRLIEANRQDQRVHRYQTFAELLGYCRLSADPVGELVLRVFGVATGERIRLSNKVCTALQLIEHCQDARQDYLRGRVYLPLEDLHRFGCAPADLAANRASEPVRTAVAYTLARAERLLAEGSALVRTLVGWRRAAIAGYVAGGWSAIDGIRAVDFDVLAGVRRPRRTDLLRHWAPLLASGRSVGWVVS